jgi:type I restriction enzyme R subunit
MPRATHAQLQAFRTSPSLRIAVTVDMIATGTDVKPLECVFFMRDVRSAQYFEQMKGRGARTIEPRGLPGRHPGREGQDSASSSLTPSASPSTTSSTRR